MIEIFMPKAGMDMKEGKLIRWLKEVGDPVEMDEPIMEIETDKITMEAEAPGRGILLAKYVGDGDVLPVLHVMGYIGEAGEKVPAHTPCKLKRKESLGGEAGYIPATPYAKVLAKERGINLNQVTPSGKRGVLLGRDIPIHSGGEKMVPLTGMRKAIARKTTKSHMECPAVTQNMKVDVTKLLEVRQEINAKGQHKFSLNDFVLKATATAIAEHECMRTVLSGDTLVIKQDVHLGFVVSVNNGLLVPVIKDANTRTLLEISKHAKDLAKRARENTLKPHELTGSVFTVSNMGMFDVLSFTPILNQPEPGILGVCAVQDELALMEGQVVVKKVMILSLTYDHRIMDSVDAAKFQQRVKELLENPYSCE